jgi:segregation and condensation protein B
MEIKEIQSIIESLLFASGEPLSSDVLAEVLNIDKVAIKKIMKNLIDIYNFERRGLQIIEVEDSYQLSTRPEYNKYVKQIARSKHNAALSEAALEVLAIIAYNQPVTKNNVERIRGINSDSVINNLLVRGLVEEKGRLNAPGKPIIFGTSQNFLKCFGFKTLDELPTIESKDEDIQMEFIQQ